MKNKKAIIMIVIVSILVFISVAVFALVNSKTISVFSNNIENIEDLPINLKDISNLNAFLQGYEEHVVSGVDNSRKKHAYIKYNLYYVEYIF